MDNVRVRPAERDVLTCSLAPVMTSSLTCSFLAALAGLEKGAGERGAVEEPPV